MKVVEEILRERKREVEVEGFTHLHDDAHPPGTLATAAACYAFHAFSDEGGVPFAWPWDAEWWKPKNPRRDLVRAAALIVAEIERMDRSN